MYCKYYLFLGGQSAAIRVSKQLKKTNKKIKEQLRSYNIIGGELVSLPLKLEFDDVKSCDGELWDALKSKSETVQRHSVPVSIKHQTVKWHCMEKRAAEEQQLVKAEMKSALKWYMYQHACILNVVPLYNRGEKAVIIKEGLYVEMVFNSLLNVFQPYVNDSSFSTLNGFANMVGLNKVEEVAISSLGSEINDLNSTMDCISDFELSDDSESDDDFTDSEILQVLSSLSGD
jgi:hypothetical protein